MIQTKSEDKTLITLFYLNLKTNIKQVIQF